MEAGASASMQDEVVAAPPSCTLPLNMALQKVWDVRFFDPGPGESGGHREAPQSPPWAFPGPPRASRRPPGPKTNQSERPRNLKELIMQWSRSALHVVSSIGHLRFRLN